MCAESWFRTYDTRKRIVSIVELRNGNFLKTLLEGAQTSLMLKGVGIPLDDCLLLECHAVVAGGQVVFPAQSRLSVIA